MEIFPLPLPEHSNVLVIGAGGGFDFLCGLPIVLDLERLGHTVHIGNYSFTELYKVMDAKRHNDFLVEINSDSFHTEHGYFPEKHLSDWYKQRFGINRTVWCLGLGGVVPTLVSYNFLAEYLHLDAIICIDGGVDGIFRGDEFELGTPSMDSISVVATSLCNVQHKIYACTAFGIDGAESNLSHAQVLHRISNLMSQDCMLGVSSLLKNTNSGIDFLDAVDFINQRMNPSQKSTIVNAIAESIIGSYGFTSVNAKTQERKCWVSPLTALYWFFDAEGVAKMKLFYKDILDSNTVSDVGQAINSLRSETSTKPHESIPI